VCGAHVGNIPVMSLALWANQKVRLYACFGGAAEFFPSEALRRDPGGDSDWMVKVDKGKNISRNRSSGDIHE
jgi:hypothetical protein